jgi:hypothetical protein
LCRGHGAAKSGFDYLKIKLFAGHREATQALVLSVAGVTAIMLIVNLILTVGIDAPSSTHRYWKEKGHQTSGDRSSFVETASFARKARPGQQ